MLLRHFGKSRTASLLSSLFFAANPIIGTRLAFGQAWILVKLSGVVLFISFFAYEIRKKNLIIISALLLSLCTLPITFFGHPAYMYFWVFLYLFFCCFCSFQPSSSFQVNKATCRNFCFFFVVKCMVDRSNILRIS